MSASETNLSSFVKFNRKQLGLTQEELAERAGVGLRFVRDLEQGKESLRMDKVNQVLQLFGYVLSPSSGRIMDPFYIHRHHFNKGVRIDLKNKTSLWGIIIGEVRKHHQITGWRFVSNNNAIQFKKTNDEGLVKDIPHADIESIENL